MLPRHSVTASQRHISKQISMRNAEFLENLFEKCVMRK